MVQAEPGTPCFAKTQESCQRLMWSFRKDIEASVGGSHWPNIEQMEHESG